MRVNGICKGKFGSGLMQCLLLSLGIGVVNAADISMPESSPAAQEPIEEMEIVGQASLLSLRAEIVDVETRMFDLFNEFNDKREFDVSCEKIKVTGSRIAERECAPIYMKRARMNKSHDYLFSDLLTKKTPGEPGKSMNTKGVQLTDEQLWFQNQHKHEEFNAHFRELAAQHPELASTALDLQAKKQRLEELEARQRTEGSAVNLFSGSGNKDEAQ